MSDIVACFTIIAKRGIHPSRYNIVVDFEIGDDINKLLLDHLLAEELTLLSVESITIEKRCAGCRENQPGQLAHMEPGGCLYVDSQSSEEL